jgi:hypothetical protein
MMAEEKKGQRDIKRSCDQRVSFDVVINDDSDADETSFGEYYGCI